LLDVSQRPLTDARLAQYPASPPTDLLREPRRGDLRRAAIVKDDPAPPNDVDPRGDPESHRHHLRRRRSLSMRDLGMFARKVDPSRYPATLIAVPSPAVQPRLLPDECACSLSGLDQFFCPQRCQGARGGRSGDAPFLRDLPFARYLVSRT